MTARLALADGRTDMARDHTAGFSPPREESQQNGQTQVKSPELAALQTLLPVHTPMHSQVESVPQPRAVSTQ
jgi:hypothetical protein